MITTLLLPLGHISNKCMPEDHYEICPCHDAGVCNYDRWCLEARRTSQHPETRCRPDYEFSVNASESSRWTGSRGTTQRSYGAYVDPQWKSRSLMFVLSTSNKFYVWTMFKLWKYHGHLFFVCETTQLVIFMCMMDIYEFAWIWKFKYEECDCLAGEMRNRPTLFLVVPSVSADI